MDALQGKGRLVGMTGAHNAPTFCAPRQASSTLEPALAFDANPGPQLVAHLVVAESHSTQLATPFASRVGDLPGSSFRSGSHGMIWSTAQATV